MLVTSAAAVLDATARFARWRIKRCATRGRACAFHHHPEHTPYLTVRARAKRKLDKLNALALQDPHAVQGAMPLLKWLAK